MTSFIIEHQCPQCGAPAELEETDRLFQCGFCRVRSYLSVPDIFRYALPHKAPAGTQLIYVPYWRFKGMLFSCVPGSIHNRFVDISQQAITSQCFPFSMGFRGQTQKLRFANTVTEGVFLEPTVTRADLLRSIDERLSANLRKPILHQAHIGETFSLLYAPFYLKEKVVDAVLNEAVPGSTSGEVAPLLQQPIEPNWPIGFVATLCPQCGWDLSGAKDALALTCTNCRSVWHLKHGKLEVLTTAYLSEPEENPSYLPFWRIQADITGIALNSYADFIRVANLPKVAQKGWDERPFYFWSPAFKARPQSYLTFAAHATTFQVPDKLTPGLPAGTLHSVSMPLQEAIESLTLILAYFAKPRQRMEAILPQLRIAPRRAMLVYLPFKDGPHELVQPSMNLAISKNLLSHAKNL
jgi:hypothetical protein